MTLRQVCVEWDDASSLNGAWKSEGEITAFLEDHTVCRTWGVILKQDAREIIVAGCLAPGAASSLWKIPAGLVRRIYKLSGGPKVEAE